VKEQARGTAHVKNDEKDDIDGVEKNEDPK
jgi:hypothetical protein